jgi:hypothetical protein
MEAALGGANKDHIETRGTLGELQMLAQEHFGRQRDTGLLPRQYRIGSLLLGFASLDFHESQMLSAPGDEINLPTPGFVTMSENIITLAFEKLAGTAFCRNTYRVGSPPGCILRKSHGFLSLNFNAKL